MNASAYYISMNDGLSADLKEFTNAIGFIKIKKYTTLREVEKQALQTPICFFIFDQVSDILQLKSIVSSIRICKRHDIRFSTLIYICHSPSPKTIKTGILMGFDDVIAKPFNINEIKLRLSKQINNIISYYETDKYFGPDRRRLGKKLLALKTENRKNIQYSHYKFIRDLKDGIIIQDKKILIP